MPSPEPGRDGQQDDRRRYPYLASLNAAQLKVAPPDVPLQILAGPGSGKTRVLTSRVAHLVKKHGYKPHQITAVTFTNKAAAEMRKRLQALLGEQAAGELVLGTFHATCARFLRRYAGRIGLDNNFAIADADDCKKIMARLLKERSDELAAMHMSLKEGAVLSEISKAKAKGETPDAMAIRAARDPESSTSTLSIIAELYEEYEGSLREANALDFDDVLVFGLRLFRENPNILESCFHILVDEFQDTNTTQYELMRCFAKAHGGVSIVGDPDQSIYGWRSAEIENLNKMTEDFDNVMAIHLEENYRSTGAILAASHSIVKQDPKRIQKNLYTSHPMSSTVTLKLFAHPGVEASYIANEIKRMVAYTGNMLNYDDFSILLRYNALSRVIESALQKEAIPSRVIGGHKFFERMEIKDLLAYLQLADNPNFTPAFLRVVNTPRRSIGDKSVADIVTAAKKAKVTPMELVESIIDGDKLPPGIKPAMKRKLEGFISVVRKLRRAALKGMAVDDLIRLALEKTHYEEYLRTSQPDFDQRWENVQELINYSVIVAQERGRQSEVVDPDGFVAASTVPLRAEVKVEAPLHPMFRQSAGSRSRSASVDVKDVKPARNTRVKVENDIVEILDSDDEELSELDGDTPTAPTNADSMTPLRYFLQTSMLSTDTESAEEDSKKPKVTISTVHAAKGLEWPVVFIPAVEQGTFPSYRCVEEHEIAEERRLLYVAMTRAQAFLTLSHSQSRMAGGEESQRELSEFVAKSVRKEPTMFDSEMPTIDAPVRRELSKILDRPPPDEAETQDLIKKHVHAAPVLSTWDAPEPGGGRWTRFAKRGEGCSMAYWRNNQDDFNLPTTPPPGATFSSAKASMGWSRPTEVSPPKPPPQRLQSSNRNMPAPLPFAWESEPAKPAASLSAFTAGSSSSLAAMKALGLPDDLPPAAPSISDLAKGTPLAGGTGGTGTVPLARGTKRLGMGRPAPWGAAKRAKQ